MFLGVVGPARPKFFKVKAASLLLPLVHNQWRAHIPNPAVFILDNVKI